MTQQNKTLPSVYYEPDYSPKAVLRGVQSLLRYVMSKWWLILLIAAIAGGMRAIMSNLKKPVYKADISFLIDEEKDQTHRSGFSAFSEQLGLDPIDGGTIFYSVNNMIELLKSRFLITKTLRSTISLNGKPTSYADFFLDSLQFREKWMPDKKYDSIRFEKMPKDSVQMLFQNNILKNIYGLLTGTYLKIDFKPKAPSFLSVSCTTEHELFSKYFLEALIHEAITHYIDSKTERAKTNLQIIQSRTDSVRNAYMGAVYGRAAFADGDLHVVRETFSVPGEKKQTDVLILKASYIDLSQNLESAKTALMNKTPVIQLLDVPILPLDVTRPSLLKSFVLFGFIGAILTVLVLIVVKLIHNILATPDAVEQAP